MMKIFNVKLLTMIFQCDSLQKHLSIVNNDLKEQEQKLRDSKRHLQLTDEDLVSVAVTLWLT